MTAQRISHYYSSRIARIPLPPPTYLAIQAPSGIDDGFRDPSPILEYASDYERLQGEGGIKPYTGRFGSGAEDAADELERSVLEDFYDYSDSHARQKPDKGPELSKRPPSDTNSDFDVPKKSSNTGPILKKRKLDKDIESYEQLNAINGPSSSNSKGKDQHVHREASYDSLSLTPKPSRKKAAKKKFGLMSEFELESASCAPSASGDVTPSISRPASPVVATSTFVYELDEQIPPLKKAKKMDDSAIMKRVKALEEAQRKVWTNIARRDIAKV